MTNDLSEASLLELTTELTVAWLSNPNTKLSAEDLPAIVRQIHGALAGLKTGANEPSPSPEAQPAVSVRRSLASKDHIVSLIDGKPYKMLKRHLAQHGLTPQQYRERYGLRPDYPMVAPSYAETRRDLARKIGLGRKTGADGAGSPRPGDTSRRRARAPEPAADSQS